MNERYAFTSDWTSGRIPHWQRLFAGFAGRPNLQAIEIGCYEGRSTVWWLENVLTHDTSRLVCIDPLPNVERRKRFLANVVASDQSHKVTFAFDLSRRVLPTLPENHFDFIYVDGSHRGLDVMTDACLAFHRLRIGGILLFDDYPWTRADMAGPPPKPAIDAFLTLAAPWLQVLHQGWQVAVRRQR